jgi:hypothetical protein
LKIRKTPDLDEWQKIGEIRTALGKYFSLCRSPDGVKLAQVDENMMIQMIIINGDPIYIDSKLEDALIRIDDVKQFLLDKSKRPEL